MARFEGSDSLGSVDRLDDEGDVVQPEIFTLHWEGPARATEPVEPGFGSADEEREAFAGECSRRMAQLHRCARGQVLWRQVAEEAGRRGDRGLWERKLHAYGWVKLRDLGSARDYAERNDLNHATVRAWISDVARLAYEVGYRLHEDRLLLVGEAPEGLAALRSAVNRDAASAEAWEAVRAAEGEFRGRDPYFHLNEGHVLRARGRLRASDATLKEGLTIAEAPSVRSLLWNARGQTFWDCGPRSDWPLPDPLERADRAFRRAAALDASKYFPFVNLAHLAVDAGDLRRAEYWVGELATARRRMGESMLVDLARYLDQAEWRPAVEETRCWRAGPARWIAAAARKGLLALLLAAFLALGVQVGSARAAEPDRGPTIASPAGPPPPARGGAGGN